MTHARCLQALLITGLLVGCLWPAQAQVPFGWQKISGPTRNYSGAEDGIVGDRQNSYAWCMEFLDNYLYVGTNRNVLSSMLGAFLPPDQWPQSVPRPPYDQRANIYRMQLSTGQWEPYFTASPLQTGPPVIGIDSGYRMMKTFKARGDLPVLYVGSMGASCRLLAIAPGALEPLPVFTITNPGTLPFGFSIRAIAEHQGSLFWASDLYDEQSQSVYPAIWHSPNPLREYQDNNAVDFPRIDVPRDWFPYGAEIMDMISYNGALYVFFLNHDLTPEKMGFWVGKVSWTPNGWRWKLIVGNRDLRAKYAPGLGNPQDAGVTSPILFKGKIYVGTGSATMIRLFATREIDTGGADPATIGAKVFRFDQRDNWERVAPPQQLRDGRFNGFLNPLNQYTWRFGVLGDKLYVGTFDARTLLDEFVPDLETGLPLLNPAGFDMYSTTNGTTWLPESINGFRDAFNYGARSFATDPRTGDLYMGTANPFYGCQIWRKKNLRTLFNR